MQTHTYKCFLDANTFKCLPNNIQAHHTYIVLGFFIYLQHKHFIEIWEIGVTDYLSDSLLTLENRFIYATGWIWFTPSGEF